MSPEAMSSDRNGSDPDGSVPDEFDQLPDIVRHDQDAQRRGARHGGTSVFTCPECGGTLWQADAGSLIQFRCHVGHAYTGDAMLREQTETLERSLWFAIRLLVDKSLLLRELAEAARRRGDGAVAGVLEAKAREAKAHSDTLRGVLDSEGAPAAALTPGG